MIVRQQPLGENRVYYERTDSALWEIIDTADRVLGRPVPDPGLAKSPRAQSRQ